MEKDRRSARSIALLAAAFFLFLSPLLLSAAEQGLGDAVKQFAGSNKRMRIAVFDFANTEGTKTRFDAFIADTLVTELSKYPVTLLERKKLEVLLGEQALSQTGVVDSDKALKLGTLLPVDVVASGSYTELGSKVVINGRFIHVGTGEILYAFTSSIDAGADAAKGTAQPAEDRKSICNANRERVRKAFYNLQDRESVRKAVDVALAIPFDNECAAHFDIMAIFIRHKIFDDRYRAFLIDTLGRIDTPSDDNRANEIIRFFAADGVVDQGEWEAGLAALRKMRQYALHLPLRPLLNVAQEKSGKVLERVDEVMRLTEAGELGRPVPIDSLTMFYGVMNSLEIHSGRAPAAPAIALFRKYQGLIPDDDKNNKKAVDLLRALYSAESEQGLSRDSLSLLIAFFRDRAPSEMLGDSAAEFLASLDASAEKQHAEDENKKEAYQKDLAQARKGLESLYCLSIGTAKKKGYHYIVDDRSLVVLRSGMKCGHVPAIKDLEADMRSGDWDRKLKAVELLSKIGDAAKPAEKTVIKYLGQQGFGAQGSRLRRFCAVTLGNIGVADPAAIDLLIASFPDYEDGVSSEAEEAIGKIGAPAIPRLIKGLGDPEHAVRLRCAKALGELGKKAEQALPELRRLAGTDADPYVRKEAKGAVQMITNDF